MQNASGTLAMVKKWVDFYKLNRRVLDGDMIHLRRPDGRDWDGWVMIDPTPPAVLRLTWKSPRMAISVSTSGLEV